MVYPSITVLFYAKNVYSWKELCYPLYNNGADLDTETLAGCMQFISYIPISAC